MSEYKKSSSSVGSTKKSGYLNDDTFNIHNELLNVKDIESDSFINELYRTRISNSGLKLSFLKYLYNFEFLSIDKISFIIPTFSHSSDLDGYGNKTVQDFFFLFEKKILEIGGVQLSGNHTYKKVFILNNGIHLSYACRKGSESVRFEFNPNHVSIDDVCSFLKFFPLYRFNLIRVTRFDIAIDYYHTLVKPELFIDSSSRMKRNIVMNGEVFETINLGSPTSAIHYTIYNKQAELKRRNINMPYCCRVEGKFKKDDYVCNCFKNPQISKIQYCDNDDSFSYYGGSLMPFKDLSFSGDIDIPEGVKNEKVLFARLMSLNDISYLRNNLPRATFYRYKSWFDSLPRSGDIIHSPVEIARHCLIDLLNSFWNNLKTLYLDTSFENELKRQEKLGGGIYNL